jgi:drug/metabolite transporter (DMT)-like permease
MGQLTASRSMARARLIMLVALAMLAFAGNSLLCRMALKQTSIDAASFTTARLLAGACMLWLVTRIQGQPAPAVPAKIAGSWLSALALFVYAATFSFAYVSMSAATGALLLFGSVQATMIGYGLWTGERLRALQLAGFALALAGLVALMLPGLAVPSLAGSLSMVTAGMAWGVYSLRGRGEINHAAISASQLTAGNFLRTVPMTLAMSLLLFNQLSLDPAGLGLAVLSGAVASGLGYIIWYSVLPLLKATDAATLQLSVPVIAALGGIAFLGEALSLPLVLASAAVLGGIALVILEKK